MSERGPTNRWEPWQRLIDSIAPYYRARRFAVRDRGRGELCDLRGAARGDRRAEMHGARSLDEGERGVTITLGDRERHLRLAADLQREAELLVRRQRWALAPGRRRKARCDAD
jgi:hypothetical protein